MKAPRSRPQGGLHCLAAPPRPFPAQCARQGRQEPPGGLHRHGLRPARARRRQDPAAPSRRPEASRAADARHAHGQDGGRRAGLHDLPAPAPRQASRHEPDRAPGWPDQAARRCRRCPGLPSDRRPSCPRFPTMPRSGASSEPSDGADRGTDCTVRQLHGAGNARAGLRRCHRQPASIEKRPARPARQPSRAAPQSGTGSQATAPPLRRPCGSQSGGLADPSRQSSRISGRHTREPVPPSSARSCLSRADASSGCRAFPRHLRHHGRHGPSRPCGAWASGASRHLDPLRLTKVVPLAIRLSSPRNFPCDFGKTGFRRTGRAAVSRNGPLMPPPRCRSRSRSRDSCGREQISTPRAQRRGVPACPVQGSASCAGPRAWNRTRGPPADRIAPVSDLHGQRMATYHLPGSGPARRQWSGPIPGDGHCCQGVPQLPAQRNRAEAAGNLRRLPPDAPRRCRARHAFPI